MTTKPPTEDSYHAPTAPTRAAGPNSAKEVFRSGGQSASRHLLCAPDELLVNPDGRPALRGYQGTLPRPRRGASSGPRSLATPRRAGKHPSQKRHSATPGPDNWSGLDPTFSVGPLDRQV